MGRGRREGRRLQCAARVRGGRAAGTREGWRGARCNDNGKRTTGREKRALAGKRGAACRRDAPAWLEERDEVRAGWVGGRRRAVPADGGRRLDEAAVVLECGRTPVACDGRARHHGPVVSVDHADQPIVEQVHIEHADGVGLDQPVQPRDAGPHLVPHLSPAKLVLRSLDCRAVGIIALVSERHRAGVVLAARHAEHLSVRGLDCLGHAAELRRQAGRAAVGLECPDHLVDKPASLDRRQRLSVEALVQPVDVPRAGLDKRLGVELEDRLEHTAPHLCPHRRCDVADGRGERLRLGLGRAWAKHAEDHRRHRTDHGEQGSGRPRERRQRGHADGEHVDCSLGRHVRVLGVGPLRGANDALKAASDVGVHLRLVGDAHRGVARPRAAALGAAQ
eukprot:scaffold4623_cov104-Isochrysis_galbana.AAC.4